MHNGLLLIDKPRGMTSHDVVATVRRAVHMQAIGHTGTLDPEASGLLGLCLGKATKCSQFFMGLEKVYRAVLQLGVCTDTQDATGRITRRDNVPELTPTLLHEVLGRFVGVIQQTPPMYSAVKYHGERLYKLARQGRVVDRQAREVSIHHLALLDVQDSQLTLSITCSKGTYIRTLGEDIGNALGCGAYVARLQRCRVGPFRLSQATSLPRLQEEAQASTVLHGMIPLAQALAFLPPLPLTTQQYTAIQSLGSKALADLVTPEPLAASCYRFCTPEGETIGVVHRAGLEAWKLHRVS